MVFRELLEKAPENALLVSIDELLLAPGWDHDPESGTRITLGSGTVLENDRIAAVLNRIRMVEPPQFARSTPRDREYAQAEFHALVLSWLEQLGDRVVNRPQAACLHGYQYTPLQDRMWFSSHGLPTAEFQLVSNARRIVGKDKEVYPFAPGTNEQALAGPPVARSTSTLLGMRPAMARHGPHALLPDTDAVTVVDGRIVTDGVSRKLQDIARRIAAKRDIKLMEIWFEYARNGEELCSVNLFPHLVERNCAAAAAKLMVHMTGAACEP